MDKYWDNVRWVLRLGLQFVLVDIRYVKISYFKFDIQLNLHKTAGTAQTTNYILAVRSYLFVHNFKYNLKQLEQINESGFLNYGK